jgi:hypothetical protein
MRSIHIFAFASLVLLPQSVWAQDAQGYAPAREASADIVETARNAGSFTILSQAIDAWGTHG